MNDADARTTVGVLPAGARLGRYQVMRRLELGGMAELYLARHVAEAGYEKVVAVKRILPHLAEDAMFVKMFLNEARLAASLDHANIVHVIDFGSDAGEHFIAMEYVHGRSLHELLRAAPAAGGLPLSCALTVVLNVAGALHYAHERTGPHGDPLGIVHRDVSPSNVLVTYEGEVKLVDFGIAKATANSTATKSGAIKGKLAYMAPEQIRGDEMDRRADVFALGILLYELCLGQRCFFASGEFALINRVASAKFTQPHSVDAAFPPELETIIVKALCVDPNDRYATAREFQRALEEFASEAGLRLSNVELSDFMQGLFGQEAYPTTQMLPLPESEAVATNPTVARTFLLRSRPRRTLALVGAALTVGLVVGLGAPALLGSRDAPPSESQVPAGRESPAPGRVDAWVVKEPIPAEPAAMPANDETSATAPQVSALAPAAADRPSTADESKSEPAPMPRRKKNRRSATTPNKSPDRRPSAPKGGEYLPPSRRDQ